MYIFRLLQQSWDILRTTTLTREEVKNAFSSLPAMTDEFANDAKKLKRNLKTADPPHDVNQKSRHVVQAQG
jgi:hypothetical protein